MDDGTRCKSIARGCCHPNSKRAAEMMKTMKMAHFPLLRSCAFSDQSFHRPDSPGKSAFLTASKFAVCDYARQSVVSLSDLGNDIYQLSLYKYVPLRLLDFAHKLTTCSFPSGILEKISRKHPVINRHHQKCKQAKIIAILNDLSSNLLTFYQ